MKTLMTKRTILIGFAAALASTTFVACSGASSATSSGEGSANDEHTGKIGAQLTLPGGESIGSIAYTLQGPKTYSATVDVSGTASTFSFVISNVVPGTGYTITLSATSADGEVACKGTSASFSVTANQTTAVNVLLACNTRLEAGSVLVSGVPYDCASWHTAVANPATTRTGGTIALVGWASAPDPSGITYQWSAPTGTITNATSSNASFTCPPTPGPVPITLVVGDGPIPQGAACPASSSTTTLTVTCSAPSACPVTPSFSALPSMTTHSANANPPALGDLNGDGVLDMAIAVNGGVEIFVSTGGGPSYVRTTLNGGENTADALLGDLDGDGKLDLVQINYGADYTQVSNGVILYPGGGDGTFGSPISLATGDTNPFSGVLADFDGDGKLDISVNHNNGGWTTKVLLNKGGWHFAESWSRKLGTNPHYSAAGDFNGDGKPDLAVATYFDGLKVVLNQGGGTFGPTISLGAPYASDLVVADFNHDEKLDVAVGNSASASVSVFLNDGTNPFAAHADYAVTAPSVGLAVADFDGKLGPDLLLGSNPSSLSLFLNRGDGTFGAETRMPGVMTPRYFAAGDFDRDGRPDVAVTFESTPSTSDSLTVLLNRCSQ
jgi:hypothetical protein